jgi:hypothetical protein
MALGMNHDLGRLARSTPFRYAQLPWAADWHIREDTIRAALIFRGLCEERHQDREPPFGRRNAWFVERRRMPASSLRRLSVSEFSCHVSALSAPTSFSFSISSRIARGVSAVASRCSHDSGVRPGCAGWGADIFAGRPPLSGFVAFVGATS